MHSEYIEQRHGGYYVAGTRISLDSVICAFDRGESPEQIFANFPLVGSLAKVYAAIAFYLNHKDELDAYLESARREYEADAISPAEGNPLLWQRLEAAKEKLSVLLP
jgi:uncharacterized protein (DUF433 family)